MKKFVLAVMLSLTSTFHGTVTAQEAEVPTGPSTQAAQIQLDEGVFLRVKEVRRLEEKGVMQLLFEVENESSADTSLMKHGLALAFGLGDIAIIDFGGRKQYRMGYANGCLCSSFPDRDGGVVRAGDTQEFWAWFGLPDNGVSNVGVQFPNQQPIMNVPVL